MNTTNIPLLALFFFMISFNGLAQAPCQANCYDVKESETQHFNMIIKDNDSCVKLTENLYFNPGPGNLFVIDRLGKVPSITASLNNPKRQSERNFIKFVIYRPKPQSEAQIYFEKAKSGLKRSESYLEDVVESSSLFCIRYKNTTFSETGEMAMSCFKMVDGGVLNFDTPSININKKEIDSTFSSRLTHEACRNIIYP